MSEIRKSWMTFVMASALVAGLLVAGCSNSDGVPTFEAAEAPELVDFGQQPFIGTPDSWPGSQGWPLEQAELSVTATEAISLTEVDISDIGNFALTLPEGTTLPLELAPGESLTFIVEYQPEQLNVVDDGQIVFLFNGFDYNVLGGGCSDDPTDEGIALQPAPVVVDLRGETLPSTAVCTTDDDCDNGLFCDGTETCVAGGCQVGDAPCDDDDVCTNDICNEESDSCTNEPDDACCSTDDDCDDGLVCNGTETCDTTTSRCLAGVDLCNDDNVCTEDSCDESDGSCTNTPIEGCCLEDADCDDELFCNGVETCDTETNECVAGTDPCEDDDICTVDLCNEEDDACTNTPIEDCCTEDADCDDGLPCNGVETCDTETSECVAGEPVDCDDGLFCNGQETCSEETGECVAGGAVNCDDGDACTIDLCDEDADACAHTPDPGLLPDRRRL